MRIKQFFLYLAISVLALASCTPEEQPPVVSYVFTDVSVEAGQASATITCRNESVDDDKVHASVLLSRNENITDATKYPMRLQNDTLRSTITGLDRNTMYFFCFEVYTANEHKRTDEVHHFQTSGGGNVTVITLEAINVTQTTATGGGSVTANGNYIVSMRGVCWDTVPNPNALQSPHVVSGQGTGTFLVNITDLVPGTSYHMRAYALCNDIVYYGDEVLFTTQSLLSPIVTTNEVTNITQTTAQGGGNVTNSGNSTVTARGICWSTSHNPTTSDSHTTDGTGTGSFTSSMTGLADTTTYYVRAYATNSAGTAYGSEVTFTTSQNVTLPMVTTDQITHITQSTATGGGNVSSDGGATVTERGICWSTSHNPTTASSHATSGTGTGSFTTNMTSLTANTTYYVRAYATNSAGTAYGSEVTFTTGQNVTTPTVTTSQVTNITQTTATGGGNVTNSGNATVTARGVCWSTSHNPTTSNSHTTDGTSTGSFTSSMTGLTANTTYYVRAYATNSAGTAYGAEVSFTTSQNGTMPTVTTSQVTNISQTTATGGGNVTNSGNATVTARGICWSTNHNPTVSNSHTADGTGTGSFTSSMTGLTANRTYYVRAYAKNSVGTAYGNEVTFSTTAEKPTVSTYQVTNVTQTTATGGGNVTSDGGASVTARGVCWSTSHNPTVSDSHTTNGTGTGSFTSSMTGLTNNMFYYVRAYATNSAGTAYGPEVTFRTSGDVYVDLGLPSGLLWATCNVGATNPEDYGDYFAWGETQPKDTYNWSTYRYCHGNYNTLTKYCNMSNCGYNGFTDNLTTLLPGDDAATANWGSGWRMPTQAEFQELFDNTTVTWITQHGVGGRLFTASNGKSIFLPTAGYRDGSTLYHINVGHYWSSSLVTYYPWDAWSIVFHSDDFGMQDIYSRFYGLSVRPVRSGR